MFKTCRVLVLAAHTALILASPAAPRVATRFALGPRLPPKLEGLTSRLQNLLVPSADAAEPHAAATTTSSNSKAKKDAVKKVATPGQDFLTGLVSGAVAGMSVDLILFPLDTVKTRLQARAGSKFSLEIFQGMYSGVAPALIASAPACAAFFGAYDYLKRCLTTRLPDKYLPLAHVAAAAGGDLTQSVVRVPFEVVKQRLQAGVDKNVGEAVSTILKTSGPKGFFTGWSALALRDLPFDIIEFPLYEALKSVWAEKKGAKLDTWESSLCGSLAGGIAAGLTTPLDVVKTRLMTQPRGTYKSLGDCMVRIAKEEGFKSLYKGLVPRVINISLGGAIFFGAYEGVKAFSEKAIVQGEFSEWMSRFKRKEGEKSK